MEKRALADTWRNAVNPVAQAESTNGFHLPPSQSSVLPPERLRAWMQPTGKQVIET